MTTHHPSSWYADLLVEAFELADYLHLHPSRSTLAFGVDVVLTQDSQEGIGFGLLVIEDQSEQRESPSRDDRRRVEEHCILHKLLEQKKKSNKSRSQHPGLLFIQASLGFEPAKRKM